VMTYDELYSAILDILPGAELGSDNDGQIVVYTGLAVDIMDMDGPLLVMADEGVLHCDYCDRLEYADDLTPDWNGETGNHLSCECDPSDGSDHTFDLTCGCREGGN